MKTFLNSGDRTEILERLNKLNPDSRRKWGKMTPHQMICHVSDSYKTTMGDKSVSEVGNILYRTVGKWIALYAPIEWPKGVETRPEVSQDQDGGGTRPVEFEKDVKELEQIIVRFTATEKAFEWRRHPLFGRMSDKEWMRWGYLHADHHLRQFGV